MDRKACIVRLDVNTTKNKDGREFHYAALDDVRTIMVQKWAAHEALKKAGTICPCVSAVRRQSDQEFPQGGSPHARGGLPGARLHDFMRTAVRNLERAGVSRSVAMKVTGHKTEAIYRRYAIVSSADLAEVAKKLQAMALGTISGTIDVSSEPTDQQKASA